MTDKQIIIDGTKCKYAHFDGGNTQRLLCAIDDCFCDCYRENDCYYKQLKAKEQECEELKKGYAELTETVSLYMDDFTGYNEELGGFDIVLCVKELMEQLEAYKMEADEGKEINAELKAENETYKKILEDEDVQLALTEIRSGERHLWHNKADKLSKTLTEIKEIVFPKNQLIITDSPIILKIQQKISEVSNDMENN